jgi:cytosine/uracil/thiamine/allantoin permease
MSFLLLIGSFFVPLLGVVAADYFLHQRRRYDVDALYKAGGRYWFAGGFNWFAIGVGARRYPVLAPDRPTTAHARPARPHVAAGRQSLPTLSQFGGTIPSFLVAFAFYALMGRVNTRTAPHLTTQTP